MLLSWLYKVLTVSALVFGIGIAFVHADTVVKDSRYSQLSNEQAIDFLGEVMNRCADVQASASESCELGVLSQIDGGAVDLLPPAAPVAYPAVESETSSGG